MAPTTIVAIAYRSTNYYVVGAGTMRLLVDLGYPGSLGEMRAALGRKGIALTDITHGFATHYHPDHAGLAQEMKASGMVLIITPEQLASAPAMKQWTKPVDRYVDVNLDDNQTRIVTTGASRAFFNDLGIGAELIHTPGHSDDSISLLLDDGCVFTGDLTPPGFATDEDAETVTRSWQTLRDRGARTIYPGHGPVKALERP